MAEDIPVRNITKFNGANFQGWKFQIKALFTANGIKDVVDGKREMPADPNSSAAKTWDKENAKKQCSLYHPLWNMIS